VGGRAPRPAGARPRPGGWPGSAASTSARPQWSRARRSAWSSGRRAAACWISARPLGRVSRLVQEPARRPPAPLPHDVSAQLNSEACLAGARSWTAARPRAGTVHQGRQARASAAASAARTGLHARHRRARSRGARGGGGRRACSPEASRKCRMLGSAALRNSSTNSASSSSTCARGAGARLHSQPPVQARQAARPGGHAAALDGRALGDRSAPPLARAAPGRAGRRTRRLHLEMSASSAWLTTASAAVQRRWRGTAQRSGARFQYGTGYVLRYSASRSTVYTACRPPAARRSGRFPPCPLPQWPPCCCGARRTGDGVRVRLHAAGWNRRRARWLGAGTSAQAAGRSAPG